MSDDEEFYVPELIGKRLEKVTAAWIHHADDPPELQHLWLHAEDRALPLWHDGTNGGEISLPAFLALAGPHLAPTWPPTRTWSTADPGSEPAPARARRSGRSRRRPHPLGCAPPQGRRPARFFRRSAVNVRTRIRMYASLTLLVVIVFFCQIAGGLGLALIGIVAWFVLEQLLVALMPISFMPAPKGAQATSGMYRGWAARLAGGLGLAKGRTARADLARLDSGVMLSVVSYGLRDGSQTMGYLLLRRSAEGGVDVSWQNRGKGQQVHPVDYAGTMTLHQGREQQNPTQKKFGFTVSVEFGTGSYWVRQHDAELLQLTFPQPSEAVSAS